MTRFSKTLPRALACLTSLVLISLSTLAAAKAGPDPTPVLRLENGGHGATITQIEMLPTKQIIASVSEDKTLRLWQYPTLDLIRTVRAPIGRGYEGNLYALATSPDESVIAISGWTGFEWNKSIALYLIDVNTGEMLTTRGGFREVISNMRFSPDGKRLYVAMPNQAGMSVLDSQTLETLYEDSAYEDNTIGIDFNGDEVVSSSHDGHLRLYNVDGTEVRKFKTSPGRQPTAVRYSPDKRWLAVGFMDRADVQLWHAVPFKPGPAVDTSCFEDQRNTPRVFWSPSGDSLLAYGTYDGQGNAPLYRWRISNGNIGPCESLRSNRRNFSAMQAVDDQHLVFGTTDTVVGVLDLSTMLETKGGTAVPDFRDMGDTLRASENGAVVEFATSRGGQDILNFAVEHRRLRSTRRSSPRLFAAEKSRPGLQLEDWKHGQHPTINGVPIQLARHETVNDVALVNITDEAILGTGWGILRVDATGKLLWRNQTSSAVQAVLVTQDDQRVIAALADGTLRWYNLQNGAELLALYAESAPAGEQREWAAWVPQGYYLSSYYGDKLFGWHLNRRADQTAEFFKAFQYERFLYRPDIIDKIFNAKAATAASAPEKTQALLTQLREASPGPLNVTVSAVSQGVVTISVRANARTLPLQDFAVYLNNIPILTYEDRKLPDGGVPEISRSFDVPLYTQYNTLRVEAFNGQSMAIAEETIKTTEPIRQATRGDLYLVAVGINEFPNFTGDAASINLNFPAADAKAFAETIEEYASPLFRHLHTIDLTDFSEKKPDKTNIEDALFQLSNATRDDTVVVFLASHGFSDAAGNYYFVPRDVKPEELETLVKEGVAGDSLLSWQSFLEALQRSAGRRLLVVDTCQARNISGPLDSHSLEKRSASAQFTLLAAARGNEESQELPELGHGLFTYALLQAIKGNSDANQDRRKSISELFSFAAPVVEELRNKSKPQTPQLVTTAPLDETALASVRDPE